MRKVRVGDLKLDFRLHPRERLDLEHVERLVHAIRSDESLPPVVVCQKSRRVVDGFHRVTAFIRANGNGALVGAVEKQYADDGELFFDAIRYNASHGARIEQQDFAKCMAVAVRLEVDLSSVAGLLHVPVGKLGDLRVANQLDDDNPVVHAISAARRDRATFPPGRKKQSPGSNVFGMIDRVIRAIDLGHVDADDPVIRQALRGLHKRIGKILFAGNQK